MKSKDEAAKAILRLLLDMKWPTVGYHDHHMRHGGLYIVSRSPADDESIQVNSDEIYIGRYSPLADAIRDWQAADGEEVEL